MGEKNDYEGMVTELVAGKVIFPTSASGIDWNNAIDHSIGIIKRYEKGDGLFQQKTGD